LPGYREWWYATDPYTLVGKCDSWRFGVTINARNNANNLLNAGTHNFYVETTFNNAFAGDTNSSPYFSIKPIPYCCLNVPYTYNNGAVDPDGDSLTSEMVQPLNNTTCSAAQTVVPWNNPVTTPGWSNFGVPFNPLQANNGFALAATTGQMNFTPFQAGPSTLSIRTWEWRRGVKIGSIMRDVQVQVLTSCNNVPVPPVRPGTGNANTGLVNKTATGCVGDLVGFNWTFTSPDPAAVLIGKDNHTSIPALQNATVTYTGQGTPSVTGNFSWVPTAAGTYILIVTAVDTTCYPPGILYNYTDNFTINVYEPVQALGDTSICAGDPAQLRAVFGGGGVYTWRVVEGQQGSLITNTGTPVIANPYATTKYEVTASVTAKCSRNKDTVTVTMLPSAEFTQMPDALTCPGVAVELDPQIVVKPGVTYNATWSPATALASATGLTNTSTPQTDITYYVVMSSSDTKCKSFDTVKVDVLDGFLLGNNDTAICMGDKVNVRINGDNRYTYLWETFTDPGSTSVFSDPNIIDPVITPSSKVGEYTYIVRAQHANCPGHDSVARFKIDVQPIPTVKVNDDAIVCFGDTMQMYSIVAPDDYSKYSYSWDPGMAMDKPASAAPIFAALNSGKTTITLTVSTPAGCKGTDDVTLDVLPSDFMTLSPDTAICPDDTIQIRMTGVALKSFFWKADEAIGDVNSQTPNVWPATTKDFTVYGRDTNTCYDTQTVRITVRPRAMLDLPDTVKLYPGQSYQMNPGGNALYYSWFPPVGLDRTDIANPVAKPEVNTRYFLTAVTEGNCTVTDQVDVLVAPDSYIDMPNAFSPANGKTLKAVRIGDARLKSFSIYNRWGVKMFETSDINDGWDGKLKDQPQPMGVYIYTIEAVTPAGKKFVKQGNITLIR
jgi:gliding motility-associated-like protein